MITNTANKVIYTGDGQTTQFDVPFPFNAATELKLFLHTEGSALDTEITSNWSYDYNTEKLTYPTTGAALASSQQLVILRSTPQTQEKDHTVRLFTSQDVETIADKLTREVQDLQEKVDRSIKYPASHTGVVDGTEYISDLEELVEEANQAAGTATDQADIATTKAQQAADSADAAAQSASDASDSADAAGDSENNASSSASNAATDAQRAEDAWNNISNWLAVVQLLKDGDIHTYIAGTATTEYDGSLTVFPVENEFAAPISVFVNGQYKELTTEYTEDKTNNVITFTSSLKSGDRVNIVANITVADATDFSGLISTAIATHNTASSSHSTAMASKQDVSNLVTSMSGSSTNSQYPSAKSVYDALALKADASALTSGLADKVAKAGDTMTGHLVMSNKSVQLRDSENDGYDLKATQSNSATQVQLLNKTSGKGILLDSANADKPFYYNGSSNDAVILASDKSVANGVASLDANTKIPNAQIPAATALALGGVILVYDSTTNTLNIKTS